MEKIRLRGKIISKTDMLNNPEKYRNRTILCLEPSSAGKLKEYFKEANVDRQIITLDDWSKDPSAGQKKKFFALVDRLAEHWAAGRIATTKDKDEVYRMVVEMMDLIDENGEKVRSVKPLDSKELSGTIEMLLDWLASEGIDTTYLR